MGASLLKERHDPWSPIDAESAHMRISNYVPGPVRLTG
jgi:hypothetical protein